MNIAIIGYGSIGQRHEKNCLALGHSVDVLSRHQRRKFAREIYDLVIICSKTSEHLQDVQKFKDISENFLVEKPLFSSYSGALQIKRMLTNKKVRVGYCLIFNLIVDKVKKIIDKGTLGDISLVQIYSGSYLPDWRKGDYRSGYSAIKNEGGGVELDLIHEVNYSQYLFPDKVSGVYSYKAKVSKLEITSNDLAVFIIKQKRRFLTITLNYFQQFPERYIKLVGEKGVLFADLINNKIEIFGQKGQKSLTKKFDFNYNQMYIDEIESMIKFIKGKERQKRILSMDQAIKDLSIVEGEIN